MGTVMPYQSGTQHHDQQLFHHQYPLTQSYCGNYAQSLPRPVVYSSHIMEHHTQQQQDMDAYNYPQAQMYPASLPNPMIPNTQAPGWVKPFDEAEVQVEGIMPYSYGMPRYGPVSSPSLLLLARVDTLYGSVGGEQSSSPGALCSESPERSCGNWC